MPITLNDCYTTADLPPEPGTETQAPDGYRARRRPIVDASEEQRLVAAFLASGHQIKVCPPAYVARSSQYRVSEPPKMAA